MSEETIVRHYGRGFATLLHCWCIIGGYSFVFFVLAFFLQNGAKDDLAVVIMAFSLLIFCCFVYTLPSVIACSSVHPSRTGIYFVNWFLGWTVLGWMIAMIWAMAGMNARAVLLQDADSSGMVGLNLQGRRASVSGSSGLATLLQFVGAAAALVFLYFGIQNKRSGESQGLEATLRNLVASGRQSAQITPPRTTSSPRAEEDRTKPSVELDDEPVDPNLVPGVARALSGVPGALVCPDFQTVSMLFDLYNNAWEEKAQDFFTKGESKLIRGPAASAPDPSLYGCVLLKPGTPILIDKQHMVPLVRATLPDGTKIKGVTLEAMYAREQIRPY